VRRQTVKPRGGEGVRWDAARRRRGQGEAIAEDRGGLVSCPALVLGSNASSGKIPHFLYVVIIKAKQDKAQFVRSKLSLVIN